MRITLPSGTPAEIDLSVANPVMGLVIMPDIFGMRPLFDDLVAQLAREWNMAVIAIEPFPNQTLSADIAERMACVPLLSDDAVLRDMHEAADALGVGPHPLLRTLHRRLADEIGHQRIHHLQHTVNQQENVGRHLAGFELVQIPQPLRRRDEQLAD